MGNLCCHNTPYAQSSKSEIEKDGKRLLEMEIDRGYENHFERRDGEEVVIVLVARVKEN